MWADAGVVFAQLADEAIDDRHRPTPGARPVPRRTEPAGEARSFLTGESNTVTIMAGR